MAPSSSAPATKQDVHMIMSEIGKLYDANARWKDEIIETIDEKIEASVTRSEARMIHQFGVIAEDIRHDALGANKDDVENLKIRMKRVERHVGIA